ncbi:MAG: leucyl aminopeptidase, partial [Nitrosarchaeum sp.]|nr:leucyl aminopeptidase [Nitrosarchaeum sp.]
MTQAKAVVASLENVKDPLVVFTFEDVATPEFQALDVLMHGELVRARKQGVLEAGKGKLFAAQGSSGRVLVAGLGTFERCDLEVVRRAAGLAARRFQDERFTQVSVVVPQVKGYAFKECAKACAEGALLGLYKYDTYLSVKPPRIGSIAFVALSERDAHDLREAVRLARILRDAVFLARDLQNAPASVMGPSELARVAQKVAKACDLQCSVWSRKEIEKRKMGGLLAVSKGSAREPKVVVLSYRAERRAPLVCLVGKGVTFDSGGLQIKPDPAMREMKMDMSGAAVVIAAMQAIAQLKIPVSVTAVVGLTDNLLGQTPYMPGDVVRTMSGKTIEVLHTDAEGRVTLADTLHYAASLRPQAMIDFATLTGACSVALGDHAAGIFGTDQELVDALVRAGEATGERVWQLPLWEEYAEDVKGDIGDVRNIGRRSVRRVHVRPPCLCSG